MTRTVRRSTRKFKEEAINLALKSPSIVYTAKELGIPAATLHTWINLLKSKGNLATVNVTSSKDMATLLMENRRLTKELAIVKGGERNTKKGGDVLCSTPEVKYGFIQANEAEVYYNRIRRHSTLGSIAPELFENQC